MSSGSEDIAIVRNDLKHLGRNHDKLREDVKEELGEVKDQLSQVLKFMSAQQVLNENAEKERDRIFKASTLLPVALLTAIISSGVSFLFNKAPTQSTPTPQNQTYIIPSREQKFEELKVIKDEEGP